MSQFHLYDAVNLTEAIPLNDGNTAPIGTAGAVVEVFNEGEAYLVELFGGWVKADIQGDFLPTTINEPGTFMETLGVETVYPQQLKLVKSASEVSDLREQLASILDDLPEELLSQVRDFAQFLQQKQQHLTSR